MNHFSIELCVSSIFPDVPSLLSSSSMFRPLFSDLCVLVTTPHQQLWNFDTSNSAIKSFKPLGEDHGDTSWAGPPQPCHLQKTTLFWNILLSNCCYCYCCCRSSSFLYTKHFKKQHILSPRPSKISSQTPRKRYERWNNPRCAFRNPRVSP